MKAAIFEEFGDPGVLRVTDLPDPEAADGECLVRVEACAVEPGLDLKTRAGTGNWPIAFPHVLGAAAVGRVVTSPAVEGAPAVGQRVALIPSIPCLRCRYCRQGRQNACGNREIIGIHRWGGYAEFLVAPFENLVPMAESVDPLTVAAASVSFGTAWHMVASRMRVTPADVVLVMGATGNVGFAAAQIAGLHGARVIAAGRGAERLEEVLARLRALSKVEVDVVDLENPDAGASIRALTGGRGCDVAVETVGQATWATTLESMAMEGRLVSAGGRSGNEVMMNLRDGYRSNLTLSFSSQATHQDARDMFDALSRGLLEPWVGRVFPLDEVVAAHEAVASRRGPMGKTVLICS